MGVASSIFILIFQFVIDNSAEVVYNINIG